MKRRSRPPPEPTREPPPAGGPLAEETITLPIAEERLAVRKRWRTRASVCVRLRVAERATPYELPIERRAAQIERRPLNEMCDTPPEIRREGDVTIIPVVDEVPVVVTRYLVREEIIIRHEVLTEHRRGETVLRQVVADIERREHPNSSDDWEPAMTRTITAVYDDYKDAERARNDLIQAGVSANAISLIDQGGQDSRSSKRGFFSALFGGSDDRATYDESIRRGGTLLAAHVEESRVDEAIAALERSDAVDLETREAEWRTSGWTGDADDRDRGIWGEVAAEANVHDADRDRMDASYASEEGADAGWSPRDRTAGEADVIPVIEERLRVGKRDTARGGGVRVRSYVVETPVEELITLREQFVDVDRRAVERPLAPGEAAAAFQDRDVVVSEIAEEAVIEKQPVVTEEVVVRKRGGEHTETVRDTVRRTEVEVERDGKRLTDGTPEGAKGGGGQTY